MAAPVLRLSARGPRPANAGGMGTVCTGTATTEGSRLCAQGIVAQTDRTCKSLQEVSTDKCPLCSQKETVKHAMVECPMFKAAAAVIQHYYGQVTTENGTSTV